MSFNASLMNDWLAEIAVTLPVLNKWPACRSSGCLWLGHGAGLGPAAGFFSISSLLFPYNWFCLIFCSLTSAGVRWLEGGSLPTSSCRDGDTQKGKLHCKKTEIILSNLSISILLAQCNNLLCCSLLEIAGLVSHLLPETDSAASLLQLHARQTGKQYRGSKSSSTSLQRDARKTWRVASVVLQYGTRQASRRGNWISQNGLLGCWIAIQSMGRVELVPLPLVK